MPPDGDIDARAARQRAAHGPATGQRAAQRHDANGTAAGWNVGRTYTARQLTRSDKAYPGATDVAVQVAAIRPAIKPIGSGSGLLAGGPARSGARAPGHAARGGTNL